MARIDTVPRGKICSGISPGWIKYREYFEAIREIPILKLASRSSLAISMSACYGLSGNNTVSDLTLMSVRCGGALHERPLEGKKLFDSRAQTISERNSRLLPRKLATNQQTITRLTLAFTDFNRTPKSKAVGVNTGSPADFSNRVKVVKLILNRSGSSME